jgi:hypothetical protein
MAAVATNGQYVPTAATLIRLEAAYPTSAPALPIATIFTNRQTHPRDTYIPLIVISPGTFFRSAYPNPMGSIGVPSAGGSGLTTYYKKRARDSGAPATTYVTWVTTLSTQPYPFSPPFGGPLVEEILAEVWQV